MTNEAEKIDLDAAINQDQPTAEPNLISITPVNGDNTTKDSESCCDDDIDLPLNMVKGAQKAKIDKEKTDRDEALKKQAYYEKNERIAKNKATRKLRKKWAKNFLFLVCLISAISSTCVFGFAIWVLFKPNEWLFAGIIMVIGMANTLVHTYAYRYIREEIYRK